MGMTIQSAVEVLSSAAEGMSGDVRAKLMTELRRSPQSVGDLAKAIGANQPLVSHHLSLMEMAGVAVKQRDGRSVVYALNASCFTKVAEAAAVLAEAKPLPEIKAKVIVEKPAEKPAADKPKSKGKNKGKAKTETKVEAPKVEAIADTPAVAETPAEAPVAETPAADAAPVAAEPEPAVA